jgi:hypothetical protein
MIYITIFNCVKEEITLAELDTSRVFGRLVVDETLNIGSNLTVSGIVSGNGSGLTTLNASNISSGTIGSSILPYASNTNKGAIRAQVVSDTLYIWLTD